MNRAELLVAPEGKTLEFKRDLSSLKPILKRLVAFANTAGGRLVIGRANEGVSRIRNRVIARVLRELGLFEEWGTGYRRVVEDCRAGGYPAPEWEELGPALRVVFRPHPAVAAETVDVPINDRQRWFLAQLSRGIPVGAHDIAAHFQVAERTARRDIADLESKQIVEFVGAPKTGGYRIREKP